MHNLPAFPGNPEAAADARLVEQCAAGEPGDALLQIVRRHGRVVHSVCRTILGNGHDADDAFQATFLVLIRRAGAVRRPEALGSWLCGVAARVSIRAKARRGRAVGTETPLDGFPGRDPDPADDVLTRDETAQVVAELGTLPDKYRAPLVLCYLEGQTTEEAAAHLNCPVGTFKSRLAKGRDLLRGRLTRRGLALTAVAVAAVLTSARADAAPPPVEINASPAATKLAEAEVRAMRSWSGALWRTGSVVATVLVVVGVAVAFVRSSPFPGERDKGTAGSEATPPSIAKADPPQRPAGPGTLLVVNQKAATVSVVDLKTNKVRATVKTDACPHEVAVSPKGTTAAVANYGLPFGKQHGNTITLIDVATGKNVKTITLADGAAPHGLQWLDEDKLLCTSEAAAALFEIDTKKGEVLRTLKTEQQGSHMLAVPDDQKRAYSANVLSGTVTAFDLANGKKLRDVEADQGAEGLAVSPDGKFIWVANRVASTVSVIEAESLRVVATLKTTGMPFRVALSPDGKVAVVTELTTGELSVFDAVKHRETKRIDFAKQAIKFATPGPPPGPTSVVFAPDGKTVYCTVFMAASVAVVNLEKGEVTGKIAVGEAPDGIAFSHVGAAG
jgi:RNA polymerase sigma factor (sigma-70 family)